jgi:hypothetical protein
MSPKCPKKSRIYVSGPLSLCCRAPCSCLVIPSALEDAFEATWRSKVLFERAYEATVRSKSLLGVPLRPLYTVRSKSLLELASYPQWGSDQCSKLHTKLLYEVTSLCLHTRAALRWASLYSVHVYALEHTSVYIPI